MSLSNLAFKVFNKLPVPDCIKCMFQILAMSMVNGLLILILSRAILNQLLGVSVVLLTT